MTGGEEKKKKAMKAINFETSTTLIEAVRQIKAESYKTNERVVGEFNDIILDSNKSEEDNIKDYKSQWNKLNVNGVDWEQRRYEIAKEILPFVVNYDEKTTATRALCYADALIKELKQKED